MNNRFIKKLLLNQGKWEWETVEGVPPLTLDKSKYGNVKDYKIFGNSVQDGEPTPEAPIQIESVGDLVTDEADKNFGKYKIPVVISNGTEGIATSIYLDEPLRKVGNYADYIDYENKKIVRKIYREVITNVTNKSGVSGDYSVFLTDILNKPLFANDKGLCMSNKFKYYESGYNSLRNSENSIQTYITSAKQNKVAYTFDDSSINTVAKAQEKIGDGFEVCYVLATPIEEEIQLPEIFTLKRSAICIDTNVNPSKLSVTYMKK